MSFNASSVPYNTELVVNPQNPFVYLIGHSWVKNWQDHLDQFDPQVTLKFNFVFFSFFDLEKLNSQIEIIKLHPNTPSIIISFFGGNLLYNHPFDLAIVKQAFETLNYRLRQQFPTTKIIFSQIESRQYSTNNPYFTPVKSSRFHENSVKINQWLKVKITKGKLCHKLFVIRSHIGIAPNHYAGDGIHLNSLGYSHLSNLVKSWLLKTTICHNIPPGPPRFLTYCFDPDMCHNCNFLL